MKVCKSLSLSSIFASFSQRRFLLSSNRFAAVATLALLAMFSVAGLASSQTLAYEGLPLQAPAGGFNAPRAVAVDSSGNIYVADTSNNAVEEIPLGCSTTSCVVTLGSGFSSPGGIAVDSSGNVYVSDTGHSLVKEIVAVGGSIPSSPTINSLGGGFSSPYGITVDSNGNVYVADEANNAVKEIPLTCITGNNNSGCVKTLGGSFVTPYSVAVDTSGNVYVAYTNNGSSGAVKEISLSCINGSNNSSCVIQLGATNVVNNVRGIAVDSSGNVYVAVNQTGNVLKEIFAGCTSSSSSCVTSFGGGFNTPYGVAVDTNGNIYVADTSNNAVKKVARNVSNFSNTNVSSSTTQTLTFTIYNAGTIGVPQVLTQGASGADFTDVGTGTCTTNGTSFSYTANATCTLVVKFAPQYAGARYGAVRLQNNSGGNTGGLVFLNGIGTAPQLAFNAPLTPIALGSNWQNPSGVVVDGSGNIYIADSSANTVTQLVAPGYTTANIVGGGFNSPQGLAVDGRGYIYVSDSGNNAVKAIPTGCTSSSCVTTVATGVGGGGLAIDGSGNIYITNSNAVHKIVSGCTSNLCQITLGSGFSSLAGGAVDSSGNVYVADTGNKAVKEILAAGGYTTVNTLGGGFQGPNGVAVDGSGNIYVADQNSSAVYEMPAGCASSTCVTSLGGGVSYTISTGVAVDGSGNLYVNYGGVQSTLTPGAAYRFVRATAPSVSFATSTPAGSTDSTDGTQTVTLNNIGNASLSFPIPVTGNNPSFASGLLYDNASTCTQLSTTSFSPYTLAAGAICKLGIDFQPTAVGTNSGSVVLTDNNLNATSTTQSISASGTGLAATATIATVSSVSTTYGSTTGITVTATESGSAGVVTGGVVTFGTANGVGGSFNPTTCTLNSSGTCTTTTTYTPSGTLAAGTYATDITASFAANNNYALATASNTLTVAKQTPSFGTMSFSPSSSVPAGTSQAVTISDTLIYTGNGTAPTGAVTFVPNGVNYTASCSGSPLTCSATVSGSTIAALPATSYTVTAGYTADTNYTAATGTSGAFSITAVAPTVMVSVVNSPVIEYPPLVRVPVTVTESGSAGVVTGGVVTFRTLANDVGSFFPNTCTLTPSGSCTVYLEATGGLAPGTYNNEIIANFGANNNYTAASASSSLTIVPYEYTATTEPIGTASAPQTITLFVTSAGKTNGTQATGIQVLTQGAAGLDFTYTGGTCAVNTSYNMSDTCTVNVVFTPTQAWTRYGGITLVGTVGGVANTVMAQAYITGIGTGPQAIFSPGTTTTLGGGLMYPAGAAVDASGNVYIADSGNNAVKKIPANCPNSSCVITLASSYTGFSRPQSVAVDGRGNVIVADTGNDRVKIILAASGYTTVETLGYVFSAPGGVAVDDRGNIFVADSGNNAVEELAALPSGYELVLTLDNTNALVSLNNPQGVAIDASRNIWVANTNNSTLVMFQAGNGYGGVRTFTVLNLPYSVSVDGGGNVYVAELGTTAGQGVVEELQLTGTVFHPMTLATVNTSGTGTLQPFSVAVDGSGNLYFQNSTNGVNNSGVVNELNFAVPPSLNFSNTNIGSPSSDSPQTVKLTNYGNASLTLSGLAPTPNSFSLAGSTCTSSTSLAAGNTCNVVVTFSPVAIGSRTGYADITDNTLNQTGTVQQISLIGTGLAIAPTTTAVSAVVAGYGFANGVTVTATESGSAGAVTGGVVTFSTAGSVGGNFSPSTCTLSSSGTCTTTYIPSGTLAAGTYANDITASFAANNNYASASATNTLTIVGYSYMMPTEPVTTSRTGQTITMIIKTAGTINPTLATGIQVLTQGATGLDYTYGSGGSCTVNTHYNVGDACTVNVVFIPTHPWQRLGGVTLMSSTNTVMAQAFISGSGTGPQATFTTGAISTIPAAFTLPLGVTVDASGNLYVTWNNLIQEISPGCTASNCVVKTLGATSYPGGYGVHTSPSGVAVDGNGNVYVVDPGGYSTNDEVSVMTPGCASYTCITTLFEYPTFNGPSGIAVDGAGNVYIADTGNNRITQMPPWCASASCVTTLGGGFNKPDGVAVDSSGNVYVADTNNLMIKKMTTNCFSTSCVTTLINTNTLDAGGFQAPEDVAVDGSGNVYFTYIDSVARIPAGCSSPSTCVATKLGGYPAFNNLYGLAIDSGGNVFVADTGFYRADDTTDNVIKEISYSTPPTLTFASGSATSPLQQTVAVSNNGNQVLALALLPSSSPNYSLAGSTCTSSTSLTPGSGCNVSATFTPQVAGTLTSAATITDNTLNVAGTVQPIGLGGTAIATTAPTFSLAAGTYAVPQTVTISNTTVGTTIYYTTDGTIPTTSSSVYTGSITFSSPGTIQLEAIEIVSGYAPSAVVTAAYTMNPVPVISNTSPLTTTAVATTINNSSTFALTVNGSGFLSNSLVYWNKALLTTQYVNATQLIASVPVSYLNAGNVPITVQSPTPVGGTSNTWQFEVDSAAGSSGPTITTTTTTVTAGGPPANLPVTTPPTGSTITVTCLNLPTGASCSYSSITNTVTITTSSTTPKGTYMIIVVFTVTTTGHAFLWPILLLPLLFLRKKFAARRVWLTACIVLVLIGMAVSISGCAGNGGSSTIQQTTNSSPVALTIQ